MRDIFSHLDPRARLLTVIAAITIVASTPPAVLAPFSVYVVLALLLIFTSRASGAYLTLRCLAASPFIVLAAGLLAFQHGLTPESFRSGAPAAASVLLKGFTAALLLAFLTATTSLSQILWALRKMKAPHALMLILGMMYRYTGLLSEEYARMERARLCRTVRPLGNRRFSIYGHQFGTLILRSWDRADRIHAAMLARGFAGKWPALNQPRFRAIDGVFPALTACLFLIPRLFV